MDHTEQVGLEDGLFHVEQGPGLLSTDSRCPDADVDVGIRGAKYRSSPVVVVIRSTWNTAEG